MVGLDWIGSVSRWILNRIQYAWINLSRKAYDFWKNPTTLELKYYLWKKKANWVYEFSSNNSKKNVFPSGVG